MSTLRVDTIQNASGTDSPINVPGTAKAWVNFNGTGTVAIRASYNVSSITDNGTGDYTVNFTLALADTNYVIIGTAGDTGNLTSIISSAPVAAPTTSAVRFVVVNSSFANADRNSNSIAIFR